MFRKPRVTQSNVNEHAKLSVGRPPTPPAMKSSKAASTSMTPSTPSVSHRSQSTPKTNNKSFFPPSKSKAKPNGNILSFFKKVDREEQGIFLEDKSAQSW